MQRYLQAISEDRWDDAFALLEPDQFSSCHPLDLASATPSDPFTAFLGGSGDRALAEDPGSDGGKDARVAVKLRFGNQGLLGSSWELEETFGLVRKGGAWLISGDPWPYFVWLCEEMR